MRAFERDGWRFVRQRGSHMILKKTGVIPVISIPNHREVSTYTLAREIRKSGLTVAQFIELLRR